MALQPDGKVLVGGAITGFGGRDNLVRLNPDGSTDASFAPPQVSNWVNAIAVQADGRIIIAGDFEAVAGQPRAHLARLNADGTLDAGFTDLGANDRIDSLSLQPDGSLIVGGRFTEIDGLPIRYVARIILPDAAEESLVATGGGTTVTWQRGGSSPELAAAPLLFRSTNDGGTWSRLGSMRRVTGGWQASGLQPVINHPYLLRAEGLVLSDEGGSQGRIRGHGAFYFSDGIFESGFESQPSH